VPHLWGNVHAQSKALGANLSALPLQNAQAPTDQSGSLVGVLRQPCSSQGTDSAMSDREVIVVQGGWLDTPIANAGNSRSTRGRRIRIFGFSESEG
jgi:hypothetical protein